MCRIPAKNWSKQYQEDGDGDSEASANDKVNRNWPE
jgi:hypothetical protein